MFAHIDNLQMQESKTVKRYGILRQNNEFEGAFRSLDSFQIQ